MNKGINKEAAKAAWAAQAMEQHRAHERAKQAAIRPADQGLMAEAVKPGRHGLPAKSELFATGFSGEQVVRPQHRNSQQQGDPAEREARQLFPDSFVVSGGSEQPRAEQPAAPTQEAPQQAAAAPQGQPPPKSTQELFERLEARVQAVTAPLTPSPDAMVRRSFRELPGSQRDALMAKIEAQDYSPGYFSRYSDSPDYIAALVSAGLVRRFRDAQRLDPNYQPADLIRTLTGE
jgi:hypothetical protein